jgi:hypothetical protein
MQDATLAVFGLVVASPFATFLIVGAASLFRNF